MALGHTLVCPCLWETKHWQLGANSTLVLREVLDPNDVGAEMHITGLNNDALAVRGRHNRQSIRAAVQAVGTKKFPRLGVLPAPGPRLDVM